MLQLSHTHTTVKTVVVCVRKAQHAGIAVAKGAAGIAGKAIYIPGYKYIGGAKATYDDGSDGC